MKIPGKIIVLNYHSISDRGISSLTSSDPLYSVTLDAFHRQMLMLRELKIPVVPMPDLLNSNFNGPFGVALTFDDGYTSDFEIAFPVLKELKYPASFFPFLDCINKPGRVSWEQLRELSAQGFEIGSHGVTHTVFSRISGTEQKNELEKSKTEIENQLQKTVDSFSFPYGWYSKVILKRVQNAGYRSALTTGLKMNRAHPGNFLIYRWNIKRETSMEAMQKVLLMNGKIPFSDAVAFRAKLIARRIAGPVLMDKVNVYVKNLTSIK